MYICASPAVRRWLRPPAVRGLNMKVENMRFSTSISSKFNSYGSNLFQTFYCAVDTGCATLCIRRAADSEALGCVVAGFPFHFLNPRTAGGLSHLRTAGGGAHMCPPPPG